MLCDNDKIFCECLVRSEDCMHDQQTVDEYLRNEEQKQMQNSASG